MEIEAAPTRVDAVRIRECRRDICYKAANRLINMPREVNDETFQEGIQLGLYGGAPQHVIVNAVGQEILVLNSWAAGHNLPARSERARIFKAIADALRSYAPDLQ